MNRLEKNRSPDSEIVSWVRGVELLSLPHNPISDKGTGVNLNIMGLLSSHRIPLFCLKNQTSCPKSSFASENFSCSVWLSDRSQMLPRSEEASHRDLIRGISVYYLERPFPPDCRKKWQDKKCRERKKNGRVATRTPDFSQAVSAREFIERLSRRCEANTLPLSYTPFMWLGRESILSIHPWTSTYLWRYPCIHFTAVYIFLPFNIHSMVEYLSIKWLCLSG